MQFRDPHPRHRPLDAVLPIITAAFLLLVFVLLSATTVPPASVSPALGVVTPEGWITVGDTLIITAEGRLFYQGLEGTAVFDALAGRDAITPLELRVEDGLAADTFSAVLSRLGEAGVTDVMLVPVSE